ncbi:MAG: class I SAM-dependent methyltransferase [Sphingomonadales bacterium]|nr:class I SAM-dependent methyltransferase [Sphingomonadales bacterium]
MPDDAISDLHRTAIAAAALRAAHAIAGAEPKIFCDDLALALSGLSREEVLALAARVPAASAATCILRSRFAEDGLAASGPGQYVVLGAGLDSFGLRLAGRADDPQVYEVDDPAFQRWKRRRIAAAGLGVPQGLHFVPCDFETDALDAALARAGFDAGAAAFVSLLGVTQYLTRPAIRATLAWAGARPHGSRIVLSYLEANRESEALAAAMAGGGVAVPSRFAVAEMTALLREAGFTCIDHLDPAMAQATYFARRSDGLCVPGMQRLVAAAIV